MTKILLIDDNELELEYLKGALEKYGYECETLTEPERAVEVAARTQPNLILLDLIMPGVNGLQVCKLLKSNPETTNISVVFISSESTTDSILDGWHVGGVDYIPKGVPISELVAKLSLRAAVELMHKASESYKQTMIEIKARNDCPAY